MAGFTVRRQLVVPVASVSLLLVLTGCTTMVGAPQPGTVIDLLQQDWQHVPGISVDEDGLQVTATGRSIVEQDGGGGQPDTPVNLAGTHLVGVEDFTLNASFLDASADVTLSLHDSPRR